MAAAKATILIPSGPSHDPGRKHLFVVCTDPCGGGLQVVVSVSTKINDLCDQTCILQPREHPFLTAESYVFYRKARTEPNSSLVRGVNEGFFVPREALNGQSFLRVLRGLCQSPQTPIKIKRYLGCPAPASTNR